MNCLFKAALSQKTKTISLKLLKISSAEKNCRFGDSSL